MSYYWISFKDNKNFKNLLIKSIAVNYFLTTIFDILFIKFNIDFKNEKYKVLLYFIISGILGFLIGKITSHRWFNTILDKLHIGRTTNENIWDDVIKPNTWVRVFMNDNTSYMGLYKYGEPFKSDPVIALACWQKLNKNTDIVIDNSQNSNEILLVNTKDFEKIELTYSPIENKFKKWLYKNIFHKEQEN